MLKHRIALAVSGYLILQIGVWGLAFLLHIIPHGVWWTLPLMTTAIILAAPFVAVGAFLMLESIRAPDSYLQFTLDKVQKRKN